MVLLRCTSGSQQGCHLFIGMYYQYAGFGSPEETLWVNDARIYFRDNCPSSVVTTTKARLGI